MSLNATDLPNSEVEGLSLQKAACCMCIMRASIKLKLRLDGGREQARPKRSALWSETGLTGSRRIEQGESWQ